MDNKKKVRYLLTWNHLVLFVQCNDGCVRLPYLSHNETFESLLWLNGIKFFINAKLEYNGTTLIHIKLTTLNTHTLSNIFGKTIICGFAYTIIKKDDFIEPYILIGGSCHRFVGKFFKNVKKIMNVRNVMVFYPQ